MTSKLGTLVVVAILVIIVASFLAGSKWGTQREYSHFRPSSITLIGKVDTLKVDNKFVGITAFAAMIFPPRADTVYVMYNTQSDLFDIIFHPSR